MENHLRVPSLRATQTYRTQFFHRELAGIMTASTPEAPFIDRTNAPKQMQPLTVLKPAKQTAPVLYASPHSGNQYPVDFVANANLDPLSLRRSEDAFVHELYDSCIQYGSPLLHANFPRAYVDANREPYELDPDMFSGPLPSYVNVDSLRAQAGLGTIARIVTNGADIYREKLSFTEVHQRIDGLYHPYHATLRHLIETTRTQFGACLLIDCHSMPSRVEATSAKGRIPDIILGDRFGTSCAEWVSDFAQVILEEQGFSVMRNRPYAGGFTTDHYGNPTQRVHALQIELNRALYMDEETITRLNAFNDIKSRLEGFIQRLNTLDPEDL